MLCYTIVICRDEQGIPLDRGNVCVADKGVSRLRRATSADDLWSSLQSNKRVGGKYDLSDQRKVNADND